MKIPSRPTSALLLVSFVGWLLLLAAPGNPMFLPAICGVSFSRNLAGIGPAIESRAARDAGDAVTLRLDAHC